MIQGATLAAGFADCGDILELVGTSEEMSAYVILSRLTSADVCLLLRAFSPCLFTLGTAAGPSCLVEHLRCRFSPERTTRSVEEPRAFHDRTTGEQELQRQKREGLFIIASMLSLQSSFASTRIRS